MTVTIETARRPIRSGLHRLDPVSLQQLDAAASLQRRRDRKYLLDQRQLDRFLQVLPADSQVLEIDGRREFGYSSTYFDTPDLTCFLAAAHRRPDRFKVRTRTYLDSGMSLLEVKTRDRRGTTIKHRSPCSAAHQPQLTGEQQDFVSGLPGLGDRAGPLRAALTTSFQRATLLLGGEPGRLTIDTDVTCHSEACGWAGFGDLVVVETKSPGRATSADRLLWRHGHRPLRVSKYATGMALCHPGLPANTWHPAISRIRRAADGPVSE